MGSLRVDSANHAALAVLRLRAVEPYWLGVHDADCVCENLRGCADGSVCGHEAREESGGHVAHDVLNGHTGLVEGGLNDGVVLPALSENEHERQTSISTYLGVKLELDKIAHCRLDVLRRESNRTIWPSDLNNVGSDVSCRCCASCCGTTRSCCRATGCKSL